MSPRYRANDADMQAAGRTPQSFTYVVVELWSGRETDRIYTDDRTDALTLAGQMLDDAHDVFMCNQTIMPASPLRQSMVYIP